MTKPSTVVDTKVEIPVSLYEKSEKIYPREVHGLFALLRITAVTILLGLFYLMIWIPWGDRPAVLFDLPARKFYIFAWTLWPQDFLYLTLLLMMAAFALAFFTTIAGRLWCGYACPQTVWTEVFLWIERRIEGSRNKRMKRDKGPMTAEKFRVKTIKHGLWLLLSLFTGFTFVAYFTPAEVLAAEIASFSLGPWESFWILFYGFATYGNAGWMREQVCKYMCPYARFQSAMFDRDTLIIAYDETRGEPRGSRKSRTDEKKENLGDCINCKMCVQVCPTGIDIRDGLQYECIGCSACIDVCNDVMEKVGYKKNLIRYTTQNKVDGEPSHVIRPRVIIYGLILAVLVSLLGYMLFHRSMLDLDVIRDRNQLYREVEGKIENVFTLKIINKDQRAHRYQITVSGIEDLELIVNTSSVTSEPGSVTDVPVSVRAVEDYLLNRSSDIEFHIQAIEDSKLTATEHAKFLGPIP